MTSIFPQCFLKIYFLNFFLFQGKKAIRRIENELQPNARCTRGRKEAHQNIMIVEQSSKNNLLGTYCDFCHMRGRGEAVKCWWDYDGRKLKYIFFIHANWDDCDLRPNA